MPVNRTQSRLDFGSAGNWNAIEARAREFVEKWTGETYERGESQSFWSDFLTVFGIDRKRAGVFFEYRTRKLSGAPGFVDLFWPGRLVAEQKSAGRDLNVAMKQALDYLPAMPDHELPRAVVVSDFQTFDLARLDGKGVSTTFTLEQLPAKVKLFDFLFDLDASVLSEQSPVNITAAQDVAKLHEALKAKGYRGKDLELFLTRVVFCLFAEDTGIFDPGQFSQYVRHQSSDDGRNLGRVLNELFEVLNTPDAERMQGMAHQLQAFPYVNGGLFADPIRTPSLDTITRSAILTASLQSWSEVNPSIFGSMFQGVMDEVERRNLGAHYTSEKNILRLIQPLFLDDLYAEFEAAKGSPTRLQRLHDKIAELKFLDPACGSGNFLVITYRELRRLEHKLLQETLQGQQFGLDVAHLIRVTPDQMAGIELEEFPAKVAQLALWLTDHQMNIEASKLFGGSIDLYARIPIRSQPNIVNANALRIDWGEVVELSDLDYIIGNPPFNGSRTMSKDQKDDLYEVTDDIRERGFLDFVAGWYLKSAKIMQGNKHIRTALVATNSIVQGEQTAILWEPILQLGMTIDFAHRTFKWSNDAPGQAAVFCVIVGFSGSRYENPRIFSYPDIKGEPVEEHVSRINPYLINGPDILIRSRQAAAQGVPEIHFGAMPRDGGHLIVSSEERMEMLNHHPEATPYVRPYVGAAEFINGNKRYCLWLLNAPPSLVRAIPIIRERVEASRQFRLASKAASTRKFGETPGIFAQIRESRSEYVLVPNHSSESREYIPIGFMPPEAIASNAVQIIPNATRYHFGILTSNMHMAWMRTVAGRLKGDYRYSKDIVYNNFPWPEKVTDAQREKIEQLAQAVLDARAAHPTSTLADLYDPLAMPANLRKAHNDLDRAVDRLYRSKPFDDDAERVAMLLKMYQKLTQA